MLGQGAIKSLVVAPLFLGQLSAGLWQCGIPCQGASHTLGAPSSISFCRLCPQHHWLWLVHSPRPLGSSLCLKGRAVHGVILCRFWADMRTSEQLWLHSIPIDSSSLCLQHNAAREMSLWEILQNSFRTGCHEEFTIFCYELVYFDLAIRAVMKILSTVLVAAKDAYHTGRQDSPLAMNLMYKCRKLTSVCTFGSVQHAWLSNACSGSSSKNSVTHFPI